MSELYSFKGNNSLPRDKLNYSGGLLRNIHYGDIHTKFDRHFRSDAELVPYINDGESHPTIRPENYCMPGDMVFADASEDMADIGKAIEIIDAGELPLVSGLHTILARPNEGSFALGFCAYLFSSEGVRKQIQREAQGAKVLGLSATRLGNVRLHYPSKRDEQQKIADCLSSLDELITAETQKLDALKTHKKGLMKQLFPREGKTHPDRRFLNESDWTIASLPDVAVFQEGPGIMAVDFCSEGVPLVRLAGVAGAAVTLDGCNYLDPEKVAQKWAHFRLELNDLIISTSATFGLSSIVTDVACGSVFYTGLIRFRPSNERLSLGYLKVFLGSPHFARQTESAAVGGGIKHFGPTHLKEMEIPIPPLPEQEHISDCLISADGLIEAQSQKVDALKTHKKGLMQQLFPVLDEVPA